MLRGEKRRPSQFEVVEFASEEKKYSRDHVCSNLSGQRIVQLGSRVVVGGNESLVDEILDRLVDLREEGKKRESFQPSSRFSFETCLW